MNDLDILIDFLNESTEAQDTLKEVGPVETSSGVVITPPESVEEGKKKKNEKKTPLTKAIPSVPEVNVPTGGVGLLLMIALLIVFAIVEAPGQDVSRLALIWKALIGQMKLSGSDSSGGGNTGPSLNSPGVSGGYMPGSGNFGVQGAAPSSRPGNLASQIQGGYTY